MKGLPKIALARLKAQPHSPESSAPPLRPDEFQGVGHPDANLLAAFVEKSLTEREQTQVLNHLSGCAECREVAAFALPAEAALAEPARVPAGRPWRPWLVLRWSAMAVVLGALTVVVVLHPGRWNGPPKILQQTTQLGPAGNIPAAPPTVSAPPSAPPSPEAAEAKVQGGTKQSAGELAAAGNASELPRDLVLNDQAARDKARQQLKMMASSRPPASLTSQFAPAEKGDREESRSSAHSAAALRAPAPSAAPAAVSAAGEDAMRATAMSQAGPDALPATTQSVAVGGANARAVSVEGAAAKVAAQAPRPATVRMSAQAPMSGMQAFRKKIELEPVPPAVAWSVSADGKVQRTTDGGKTFEPIAVANGMKFQSVAALGNDVWTGGEGGALFHSADGGATWRRAGISFAGNEVTETITGIQFPDPQHLIISTASGTQWLSEDAGQHWRRNP